MRVKIFHVEHSDNLPDLEEEINEFVKDVRIADIKFTSNFVTDEAIHYVALVMYDKKY